MAETAAAASRGRGRMAGGSGGVGVEATLCNGATAIVSGGNEEAKVMHPENQGQLDPTPH